jgi:hypothetical protein
VPRLGHDADRRSGNGAGLELDPGYADTALKRLAAASGLTPILSGDGRTFDEIAAARAARAAEQEG